MKRCSRISPLTFVARATGTNKMQVGVTTNLNLRMRQLNNRCTESVELVGYYPGNYMRTITSKLTRGQFSEDWYLLTGRARQFIDDFMVRPLQTARVGVCPG